MLTGFIRVVGTLNKEYTTEELTVIASKKGKAITTLANDNSNVKEFLREYVVKDGSTLVPNYIIYYSYCKKWRPTGNKLSKIGFLRKFSVVFEAKRTNKTRYYLLEEGVFDISEEALNEAKEFDKRSSNKIKRKNEQKKQSKISRITKEI